MMNLRATINTSWRALIANKGRSLLTILGIIIGIVAIVLVIALGQGAQSLILNEVQGLGGNTIIVRPGREPTGPTDAAESLLTDSLKDRDVAALSKKENVPTIKTVAPAVIVPGSVTYQENIFRPTILGWAADGLSNIFKISPDQGDLFTTDDIRQRAKVAVIGWHAKQQLFGDSDAIGQFITIHDQKFRVVATLPKLGQISLFNVDDLVLIPYSTAQKDILGINYYNEFITQIQDNADPEIAANDMRATLRELHGITDPSKDDFFIVTQADLAKSISTVTQILTVFLIAMASISLVVGGVGIMNIMLVSVTERIGEIGLRKAVGATNQDIMRQFLIEAIILTGSGGLAGTIFAISISLLITFVLRTRFALDWPYQIPFSAFILGVGVSTFIGVVFGLYPARQAARKNPINALRHE